jgi:hypothetical protein
VFLDAAANSTHMVRLDDNALRGTSRGEVESVAAERRAESHAGPKTHDRMPDSVCGAGGRLHNTSSPAYHLHLGRRACPGLGGGLPGASKPLARPNASTGLIAGRDGVSARERLRVKSSGPLAGPDENTGLIAGRDGVGTRDLRTSDP